jgi:hypothetical protein
MAFTEIIKTDVFSVQPAPTYGAVTFQAPAMGECALQAMLRLFPDPAARIKLYSAEKDLRRHLTPCLYINISDAVTGKYGGSVEGYFWDSRRNRLMQASFFLDKDGCGGLEWDWYLNCTSMLRARIESPAELLMEMPKHEEGKCLVYPEVVQKTLERLNRKPIARTVYSVILGQHGKRAISFAKYSIKQYESGSIAVCRHKGEERVSRDKYTQYLLDALTGSVLWRGSYGIPRELYSSHLFEEWGDRDGAIELLRRQLSLNEI